ncbi:preprotein translocase subunit SecD [Rhizobium sp. BK529]|uniref:hypothetical protein n=1 Tax=unclassified Rhizobium TaxID=2613769 RepID=UPI001050945B|nr:MULTISPECIES: hypothetical protein [unclassified Rhizobium]MBB3591886.1 preprotein translocase subunit SecD [Rhizobium sp. BK529]TCS08230.1 hypothetical protein EV281_10188 [Rhizobium sp. BK418]
MIHLSSVSDVSYAYLATLTRLDANGDGVLSRSERAADQKPGIIREFLEVDDAGSAQTQYRSNLAALMMEYQDNGSLTGSTVPYALQQITPDANDQPMQVYRNTYGEFDFGIAD